MYEYSSPVQRRWGFRTAVDNERHRKRELPSCDGTPPVSFRLAAGTALANTIRHAPVPGDTPLKDFRPLWCKAALLPHSAQAAQSRPISKNPDIVSSWLARPTAAHLRFRWPP